VRKKGRRDGYGWERWDGEGKEQPTLFLGSVTIFQVEMNNVCCRASVSREKRRNSHTHDSQAHINDNSATKRRRREQ